MAGETILVVDDNAANSRLMRRLLVAGGYDVRLAEDGEQLLGQLADCRPALILMDVQLPGVDGLELARRLRANPATRDIRIVAVTAEARQGDRERAADAGCDGYISKPIDTRALPGLVAAVLARPPSIRGLGG